jgi:hypothetical protein
MKSPNLKPDVGKMVEYVADALEHWETFIPKPAHKDLVEEWKNEFKQYITDIYPTEDERESDLIEDIVSGLFAAHEAWSQPVYKAPIDHESTFKLMSRPQTTQRSGDWYEQFKTQLTASELSKITGSPRERGTLVLQKAGKIDISGRGSHVPTYRDAMTPFDWGICLEPAVKLVLEKDWSAVIHEVGRFTHPTDSRLAASPDGLLLKSEKFPERAGHLVEIKCPKTRKIGVKVPMEYFYQMQLQMEVTDVRACEYVEFRFNLLDSEKVANETVAGKYHGVAVLAGCFCEEKAEWIPCKYYYGPVNDLDWKPELGLNEQTLERNVWICDAFHHETVLRDENWFANLMPKIDAFWTDVERAKAGDFVLPESTRKKKEIVTECLLVDDDEPVSQPEVKASENSTV